MTELFQAICNTYQFPCFNVLIGCKYIAQKIYEWELSSDTYEYIFGGEDSYGYLLGTYARDKDAISAGALIAEVALQAKLEDKTLIDKLHAIYTQYGIYQENVLSLHFNETKYGKEQIAIKMQSLREHKLTNILDVSVIAIEDYLIAKRFDLRSNKVDTLAFSSSNLLLYWLEDRTKIIIRPSGTEPKIKIYCGVYERHFSNLSEGIDACIQRCQKNFAFYAKLARIDVLHNLSSNFLKALD